MFEKGSHRHQIARLADRQHGHVTRAQLLALGWTADEIKSRVRARELIPAHAGVYAVGHVPRYAIARAEAAVLACGEDAALSCAASLALWDLGEWPMVMEVTAPRQRRRRGIWTHRGTFGRGDVRTHQGVRTTSPARTIVDMASRLTDGQLVRLINDARLAGHLGPSAMRDLLARCSRAKRLLGDDVDKNQRPTRSELEDRFRRFVARHRLPMPEINAILDGREVDALYRAERVIIEVDGWSTHSDRRSFERDRLKDVDALAAGQVTVRITDQRLTRGGAQEAARIGAILDARGDADGAAP